MRHKIRILPALLLGFFPVLAYAQAPLCANIYQVLYSLTPAAPGPMTGTITVSFGYSTPPQVQSNMQISVVNGVVSTCLPIGNYTVRYSVNNSPPPGQATFTRYWQVLTTTGTQTVASIETSTPAVPPIPTFGVSSPLTFVGGTIACASCLTNVTLSGDTSGSGASSIITTTTKVNGVSYGASPSTNTVPVVTGANAITYEAVPNAALVNSSTTVMGIPCTLGSSCIPISSGQLVGNLSGTVQGQDVFAVRSFLGLTTANVMNFGAVGNGTTVDTTAVQSAINSLDVNQGHSGGTVYFPKGSYPVCGVNLGFGVSLIGDGWYSKIMLAPGCNGPLLQAPSTVGYSAGYMTIKDLNLYGNDVNNLTGGTAISIGTNGSNHDDIHITGTLINHFTGDCLYWENGWHEIIVNNVIEACGGKIIDVNPQGNTSQTGTYRWIIADNDIFWNIGTGVTDSNQDGILFNGGSGKLMTGIVITGNRIGNNDIAQNAIHIHSGASFTITGNQIGGGSIMLSNTYSGILIDDDGVLASTIGDISGNNFTSGDPDGANNGNKQKYNISIQGLTSNVTVSGNQYHGALTAPMNVANTTTSVVGTDTSSAGQVIGNIGGTVQGLVGITSDGHTLTTSNGFSTGAAGETIGPLNGIAGSGPAQLRNNGTNVNTSMWYVPNGTATQSSLYLTNVDTNTSSAYGRMIFRISGAAGYFQSDLSGLGTAVSAQYFGETNTANALTTINWQQNGTTRFSFSNFNTTSPLLDMTAGGTMTGQIKTGTTTIYRCTVAGTLRVGQLTSVSADCGTAVAVGLLTN